MKMNNKVYDILKWVALVVLPAFCMLYSAIGEIWSLSYTPQIVGTIAAVNTFLGSLLGISSKKYNKTNTQ